MLLSGTDNHLAGLGQMAETIARNPGYQGHPGYEGVLNDKVAALPEILSDAGYATYMSGKWHLGLTKEATPFARGFQKSFALLPGAGNHYAWEPQLKEGPAIKFMPPIYYENDRPLALEDLPQPFYSTDTFTDRLLEYLSAHRADEATKSKPWFAYLPFTAPHWPLQADPAVVQKYAGVYDDGPVELRKRRLDNLLRLGLISKEAHDSAHPLVEAYADQKVEWDGLSAEEKKYSSKLMEIYAAMVEIMDANIGRVIDSLEKAGEFDNTVIIFQSDNGAEGALLEALPVMGPNMSAVIKQYYNNSIENIGRKDSFTYYGPLWAQAATAPSRMYKAWITEGGIRCPLILRHPDLGGKPVVKEFTTVMDILPTLLELAGISHPTQTHQGSFRGREVLAPRGKSWVPFLRGTKDSIHGAEAIHGWELFGQQAIRKGDWKAVFLPHPAGPKKWQLYDLRKDPGETNDLAEQQPDVLQDLLKLWAEYVAETGTILIDRLAPGYSPA